MNYKSKEEQLKEAIKDVIWNVYRSSDEEAEGGSTEYRMRRVMKLIKEFSE